MIFVISPQQNIDKLYIPTVLVVLIDDFYVLN